MKSKIKLKYILLAIGVLCVVAGLILIFTTPLGSVLARKAETFQLLVDRQIGNAHRLEMTNAYGNNSAYHPSVILIILALESCILQLSFVMLIPLLDVFIGMLL